MNITKNKVFSTLEYKYSEFGTRKISFLQLFTSIYVYMFIYVFYILVFN